MHRACLAKAKNSKWCFSKRMPTSSCIHTCTNIHNPPAATPLQAIDPNGREVALRRGANVLMPILTPTK